MNSQLIAALIQYGILVLIGIYATLLGHRIAGPRPGKNLKYDVWFEKNGVMFRLVGPLLIGGGLIMMAFQIAK